MFDLEDICLYRAEILVEKGGAGGGGEAGGGRKITEEGSWKMKTGEKVGQCSKADSQEQLEWKNHLTKKPRSKTAGGKLVASDDVEERSGGGRAKEQTRAKGWQL